MTSATTGRLRLTTTRPREPREPGRTASSLELFFDLVAPALADRPRPP
ncbi:hypothetical protein [Streptomyces sp. NP160]|nr:hypothetical protein [Streptomyces sp. NP160]